MAASKGVVQSKLGLMPGVPAPLTEVMDSEVVPTADPGDNLSRDITYEDVNEIRVVLKNVIKRLEPDIDHQINVINEIQIYELSMGNSREPIAKAAIRKFEAEGIINGSATHTDHGSQSGDDDDNNGSGLQPGSEIRGTSEIVVPNTYPYPYALQSQATTSRDRGKIPIIEEEEEEKEEEELQIIDSLERRSPWPSHNPNIYAEPPLYPQILYYPSLPQAHQLEVDSYAYLFGYPPQFGYGLILIRYSHIISFPEEVDTLPDTDILNHEWGFAISSNFAPAQWGSFLEVRWSREPNRGIGARDRVRRESNLIVILDRAHIVDREEDELGKVEEKRKGAEDDHQEHRQKEEVEQLCPKFSNSRSKDLHKLEHRGIGDHISMHRIPRSIRGHRCQHWFRLRMSRRRKQRNGWSQTKHQGGPHNERGRSTLTTAPIQGLDARPFGGSPTSEQMAQTHN
ncbi:hypothetical protein ACLOJK_029822 [Asimina triloba]